MSLSTANTLESESIETSWAKYLTGLILSLFGRDGLESCSSLRFLWEDDVSEGLADASERGLTDLAENDTSEGSTDASE